MHKFLEHLCPGDWLCIDLTRIGQEARPMADKIIEIGLAPVEEYYGSEVMLHYPGLYAGSTDLVCLHNGKETIVDFKQSLIVRKKKNGSKTITYRLPCTPWHTTTSTAARLNKELSWSARLTYIIKNSKQKVQAFEPGSTRH